PTGPPGPRAGGRSSSAGSAASGLPCGQGFETTSETWETSSTWCVGKTSAAGSRSSPGVNAAVFHDFARRLPAFSLDREEKRPLASTLGGAPSILPRRPLRFAPGARAMKDADVANDAGHLTGEANSSLGASLLERLRAGQPAAWERLARLY